jgi:alpha-glucosidase
MESNVPWWREAVFYHVYPRSFADSDGDGVGDLAGITARLDHLRGGPDSLGVDALWLSPFYASPMVDFGYDVSDHRAVDPAMGTLADFDALVEAAHARGIRVVVDFVPNHTSDRHRWFVDAASGRDSAHRGFYVWADPGPDGGPPNNWPSAFPATGAAWTFDAASGQYYLHSYTAAQPDLNWRNEDVVGAMTGVLDFWLDRGVDGFRIDAIHRLGKDPELRGNPPELSGYRTAHDPAIPGQLAHLDHPDVHDAVRAIRRTLDRHGDRVAIGEVGIGDMARMTRYYGAGDELHLAFVFTLWSRPWSAAAFRDTVAAVEAALPEHAWPAYALSSHDISRAATRLVGPGTVDARARVAATMLLTLRGAPFLYYGEEIGMTDVAIPPERAHDPDGRDRCRTPMQWDAGAGFSTGTPWLPVAPDADRVNVAAQRGDPGSLLSFYRALLAVRRNSPALRRGDYLAGAADPDVYAYRRRLGGEDVLVACNFAAAARPYADPDLPASGTALISTVDNLGDRAVAPLVLAPLEATVIRLSS